MRRTESGVGRIKLIFVIAVLGAVAYCAFKIVPVYVSKYEFDDKVRQLAIQATVNNSDVQAVQDQILQYAKDEGLPVTRDEITVQLGHTVTIDVSFTVPIDLKVYTWNCHMTTSAQNTQI